MRGRSCRRSGNLSYLPVRGQWISRSAIDVVAKVKSSRLVIRIMMGVDRLKCLHVMEPSEALQAQLNSPSNNLMDPHMHQALSQWSAFRSSRKGHQVRTRLLFAQSNWTQDLSRSKIHRRC